MLQFTPFAHIAPPAPPTLLDPLEAERWDWVARAHRLLYGRWEPDLEARVEKVIGFVRREAWGQVDLSANLYRQVWDAVATLYDQAPIVTHERRAGRQLADLVAKAGYWTRMPRIQRDTLGLREMLVRVDLESGRLVYRSVTPGQVTAISDPNRPDVPVEIWEARLRTTENGLKWFWDHLRLGANPVYEVLDASGDDASGFIDGRRAGDSYPYRLADGTPILPYVLYHAADTGCLWDSFSVLELVEGTYNTGVYYSHFGHVLRSATWRQRFGLDVEVETGAVEDAPENPGGLKRVRTDPSTLLLLKSTSDAQGQSQLGTFEAPISPVEMIEAIRMYEQRLVSFAGVNAADQMRMSGDPRSGYAVSVSRDGQRQVQRRYEPMFRRGDEALLQTSAVLLNRGAAGAYPEDEYRIGYRGIPLSGEEREAQRKHVLEQLEAGLLSRVAAYLELHPEASEDEARRIIAEAEAERAARAPTPTPNPAQQPDNAQETDDGRR